MQVLLWISQNTQAAEDVGFFILLALWIVCHSFGRRSL